MIRHPNKLLDKLRPSILYLKVLGLVVNEKLLVEESEKEQLAVHDKDLLQRAPQLDTDKAL